jgi:hypothetical protein
MDQAVWVDRMNLIFPAVGSSTADPVAGPAESDHRRDFAAFCFERFFAGSDWSCRLRASACDGVDRSNGRMIRGWIHSMRSSNEN